MFKAPSKVTANSYVADNVCASLVVLAKSTHNIVQQIGGLILRFDFFRSNKKRE